MTKSYRSLGILLNDCGYLFTKAWWYLRTQLTRWKYISIGRHSYVGKPLYIQQKGLQIGNNVRIYPGMRAEFGYPSARIIICDNVSIGQNFHVVCYQGNLMIGHDCTISGNVFISNIDHQYVLPGVSVMKQSMDYKETIISDNCFIGYGAAILPGTRLGRQCIVGANAVVQGDFPDYCVIMGNPGRIVKRYIAETNSWE